LFSFPDLSRLRQKLRLRPRNASMVAGAPAVAPEPLGPAARSFIGYLTERSTRHVSGWIYSPDAPAEHAEFEVWSTMPGAERMLARGRAAQFNRVVSMLGLGDGTYSFRVMLPDAVTEAERDLLEVRPVATGAPLPLDPNLRTRWEPVRFVAMDIVDNCNLRCPFCLYDYSGVHATHVMSDEVYEAALRLLPLTGPEHFWLSCLHEPTLHPKLTEYIKKIPREFRDNVFYTSNLAKRMPQAYYETLADSGLRHINISIESRVPEIYERMRKGARHRIFMESWDKMVAAFRQGSAPPKLQYIILAYQSNLREIPDLVDYLRSERLAHSIDVRHTFDMSHIPAEFKQAEYLTNDEWRWLQKQLAKYPVHEVMLSLPPDFVPEGQEPSLQPAEPVPAAQSSPSENAPAAAAAPTEAFDPIAAAQGDPRFERLAGMFEVRLSYDGTMAVCPALAGESPQGRLDHVHVNVTKIGDPAEFLMSL
jgi:MoaA/NifB/PqqE/SkfB family radical SAM enzyme